MNVVVVWGIVILVLGGVSITWLVMTPVYKGVFNTMNSTLYNQVDAQGASLLHDFNIYNGYAWGWFIALFLLAFTIWGMLKMQEREVQTDDQGGSLF